MEIALTVIFGFMIFMIILNKGRIYFLSISSLLITLAISLGIGYAITMFVLTLLGSLLNTILIVLAISVVLILLMNFVKKGRQ